MAGLDPTVCRALSGPPPVRGGHPVSVFRERHELISILLRATDDDRVSPDLFCCKRLIWKARPNKRIRCPVAQVATAVEFVSENSMDRRLRSSPGPLPFARTPDGENTKTQAHSRDSRR